MIATSFAVQEFWLPLLQIIGINIVLSGDNAVVIALAARSLSPEQQKAAILWGSGVAVVLRIILTLFAVQLLALPWLKLAGSLLLLWIGVKLLLPDEGKNGIAASSHLLDAIKVIVTADVVMSLDNVIAVAGAAKGNLLLLAIGLMLSIPLIVFGATALMRLMKSFPLIVTLGAGLLGWVSGEMAIGDSAMHGWVTSQAPILEKGVPAAGVAIVLVVGMLLKHRRPLDDPGDEGPANAA
jgi:YjbE family integral membrane protein